MTPLGGIVVGSLSTLALLAFVFWWGEWISSSRVSRVRHRQQPSRRRP